MNDENKNDLEKITSLHQAALKLSEAGENQRALELLGNALELDPDSASTHVLLGLTYQSLGQLKEAEDHFRKAIALDPNNLEAMQSLGLFLIANERKAEGMEWLLKDTRKGNWADKENLEKLTSLLDELGRSDEALSILRKTWLRNRNVEIGRLYAQKLEDTGKREEAYLIWDILAEQSKEPIDFINMGLFLYKNNRYEEAIENLQIAIDLGYEDVLVDPGFSYEEYEAAGYMWPYKRHIDYEELGGTYYIIALCYLGLKDGEKALKAIEAAINEDGAGKHNYFRRAEALMLLERFEEAIQDADKGLKLVGDDGENAYLGESLYNIKAEALQKMGRQQEALQILNQGINKYPNSLLLYYKAANQMVNYHPLKQVACSWLLECLKC